MYVHISLYIVCVRLESCIDRHASQSKTALDRSNSRDRDDDVDMSAGAPNRGQHQVYTGSLPPSAPLPGMSTAIDYPAQIRIGAAHHEYIYNRQAGSRLAYQCERGPDEDKNGSRLWMMQDPNGQKKWVALVIIGYGTLLVSQSTWTGQHTR